MIEFWSEANALSYASWSVIYASMHSNESNILLSEAYDLSNAIDPLDGASSFRWFPTNSGQ